MHFHVAAGVVFCSIAVAQEPAPSDAASIAQPQSGVRAGFWWADYDRDGLDDAFVVGADGSARLLRNSGDGTFADVTMLSGLDGLGASSFAAWQDFDRDGAPDVFVGTQSGPGHLMRNAGDGTFQDVTQFVGLTHSGRHLAAQWFDYDLDGLVDLAVRTDTGEHLYHALPSGHFEAVDLGSVRTPPIISSSADAIEINSAVGTDVSAAVAPGEDLDKPAGRRALIRPPPGLTGSAALPSPPTHLGTAPPAPLGGTYSISACPPGIGNTFVGGCLQASTTPTLGMLFPLTINLNVTGAGNVGIGTTSPAAKLDVVGTARISDTLTLSPASDQALNVSTGSIYKGGVLFAHTRGAFANTGIGTGALTNVTIGTYDTAIGYQALFSDTTGSLNTAVGGQALRFNTTGSDNTANGFFALYSNTYGSENTANGFGALLNNTSGTVNTASGARALFLNTSGYGNSATGERALYSNTTGIRNTASGRQALLSNTTGSSNTATGYQALEANTTASNNTAHGDKALFSNTTGARNTASGARALFSNTTAASNTATGYRALETNSTGSLNTASGDRALFSNTTGSSNTASGYRALQANTTGGNNTAAGNKALFSNTTGRGNTALGSDALRSNISGLANTAIGYRALFTPTNCAYNTAIGYEAMFSSTTGGDNIALGTEALYSNTSGYRNLAIGNRALRQNTTGNRNVASGTGSLQSNTTGAYNTAIGYGALFGNSTGLQNLAIGFGAGTSVSTGNNNITIANPGLNGDTATLRLGNLQTRAFISGIRGVTTGNANAIPVVIDNLGQLGTVSSSRRFKKDIVDMGDATKRLLELRPVRFRYKQEQTMPDGSEVPMEYGLIAEEVAEIFPDLVVYGDDGKPFTVKYHILSSMLLNEMEKQAKELADQRLELTRLHGLEARLAAVEARTAPAALPAVAGVGSR